MDVLSDSVLDTVRVAVSDTEAVVLSDTVRVAERVSKLEADGVGTPLREAVTVNVAEREKETVPLLRVREGVADWDAETVSEAEFDTVPDTVREWEARGEEEADTNTLLVTVVETDSESDAVDDMERVADNESDTVNDAERLIVSSAVIVEMHFSPR